MYHIAICDDDRTFISYMKRILKQAKGDDSDQFVINEFCSGEALTECIERGGTYFDLLILDMELGGMDGDETARRFRQKCKDAVLVFCSGVRAPTVQSFKATPYRYLLKSYTEKQLLHEMKEILAEVEKRAQSEYIVGHYRNNIIKVNIQNILYIENAKRGSQITVVEDCPEADFDGKILVDGKLELLSKQFSVLVFAHNSYLININHIDKIVGNVAYLDSGECLSVSRTYQKNLREVFTKSIAEKYQ